jgi:multidrug efflux system outer membrane protein
VRVASNRYREGYASYLDELDAQRNLFSAQQNVLQLRAAQLAAQVGLYRALGGGWQPDASTRTAAGTR